MPKIVTERIIDRNWGIGDGAGVDRSGGAGLTEDRIREIIQDELGNNPTIIPDPDVTVTPDDNLSATGALGSTFSGSQAYTITNVGSQAITWSAYASVNWVTLSATSGTLAAGAGTSMTVSFNSNASARPRGEYTGIIVFNAD